MEDGLIEQIISSTIDAGGMECKSNELVVTKSAFNNWMQIYGPLERVLVRARSVCRGW